MQFGSHRLSHHNLSRSYNMGRRQRNKQAPPAPIGAAEKSLKVAGGKRKAPATPVDIEGEHKAKARRGVRGGKKNKKANQEDSEQSDSEEEEEHGFGDFDPEALQQALDGPNDAGQEDEDDQSSEGESEDDDEESAGESEQSDEDGEPEPQPKPGKPTKNAKGQAQEKAAGDVPDELVSQLGFDLPDAGKLTGKKREKALAEIARLEQLLKSQGYSLESDEESKGASSKKSKDKKNASGGSKIDQGVKKPNKKAALSKDEDDDDNDDNASLNSEQMAFLDAGDDADELEGSSDEEQDEFDLNEDEDEGEGAQGENIPGSSDEDGEDDMMLPTLQDAEASIAELQGTDLKIVQQRMNETVTVLTNWKNFDKSDMTGARSRAEYVDMLLEDICSYYGYNRFLAEKFFELFPPAEVRAIPPTFPPPPTPLED